VAALLALLAVAAATPAGAARQPLTGEELLAGIQGWLDDTRSLEGRFDQLLVSGALGSGMEESGRLYIVRPGRMRWDYDEPERKVALVDGERTWLWVEEEGQLILGRLEQQGELLPRLLAGEERLARAFEISVESYPSRPARGEYEVKLVPHGGDESFAHLLLWVRPPEFAIGKAEVLDAAGNRILYRFHDLKRNGPIADEWFRFDPPEGTLVLGEH
jgi:outer membrane lipoprotein carrier protein